MVSSTGYLLTICAAAGVKDEKGWSQERFICLAL
jgi:hypothetical protein